MCTLYLLNLALFLIGALFAAAPAVACTAQTCKISLKDIESIRFVVVLQVIGAGLLCFSTIGCCLAASGKKRYRAPYLLVLLVGLLGAGLVVAFDKGLLFQPLSTFDPSAPGKTQAAIDGLASEGMQAFYRDFATVFQAAECKVEPHGLDLDVKCRDCEPIEAAFSTCTEEWKPTAESAKYVFECGKTFGNTDPACGAQCTLAFCQCAGVLGDSVQAYAAYIKYTLLAVSAIVFLLLLAASCVSRKEPAPAQVLLLHAVPQPALA